MRRRILALAASCIALSIWVAAASAQDQGGYTYDRGQNAIVIESPQDWQAWSYQNDFVSGLSVRADSTGLFRYDSGGVLPRYWRGSRNVALDAEDFTYADEVRFGGTEVRGGVEVAGRGDNGRSNNNLAARRVIDGNLESYWQPSDEHFFVDSLRNWEVLLDLGRTVVADSIRIIFPTGSDDLAEDDLGDPLRAFAILGSAGRRSGGVQQTTSPFVRYDLFAKASEGDLQPLDDEGKYLKYTVAIDPSMVDEPADFDGDGRSDMDKCFLYHVVVKATDSSMGRRTFIGAGDSARTVYENLPRERRGDRIFQRLTAGGFLSQVTEEVWGNLPADRQGPVNYFIRELPRILEIQVWARGDNMAYRPDLRAGGGLERLSDTIFGSPLNAFDGNAQTEWVANVWSPLYIKGTAWVDLGATFWVDEAFFFFKRTTDPVQGAFMGHDILVSDGTLRNPVNLVDSGDLHQLEGGLKWEQLIEASKVDNYRNGARVRMFEQPLGRLRQVRFLQIRNIDIAKQRSGQYGWAGSLAEMALHGEGYPVSLWITSPPILLQDAAVGQVQKTTLSTISWDGDAVVWREDPVTGEGQGYIEPLSQHPEAKLQVQTRTSEETSFNVTYFQTAGGVENEVDQFSYETLAEEWEIWNYLVSVGGTASHASYGHKKSADDDGDGVSNEDKPDGIDNDGDGLIDEDWFKVRREPKSTVSSDTTLTYAGWSAWSRSYRPVGGVNTAPVTSPSPRKYLQVRVNMYSDDPSKSVRINSISVGLVRPLSTEMGAEMALLTDRGLARSIADTPDTLDYMPPIGVYPLAPQVFSYFIRAAGPDPAQFQVRNGFNEVLVLTRRPAQLRGVRLGEVATAQTATALGDTVTTVARTEFQRYFEPVITAGGDTVFQDASGDQLTLLASPTSDSLWIRLPVSVNAGKSGDTHGLVELQFAVQALEEGVEFPSFVRNETDAAGLFQRIELESRDATDLVSSQTAQVRLDNSLSGMIHSIDMVPVVTPNGDLINDELRVKFTLLRVLDDIPIGVGVYDLTGRMVGEASLVSSSSVEAEIGQAGEVEFSWNGQDSEGNLVAPGVYLLRIKIDADDGAQEVLRTVSVAY